MRSLIHRVIELIKNPNRRDAGLVIFEIVGIVAIGYFMFMFGIHIGQQMDEVKKGDPMVDLRNNTGEVDVKSMNHICTVYYETSIYSADGKILRRIISKTEPDLHGNRMVTIEDGLYKSSVRSTSNTTVIVSKKIMPISWLINSMGETVYYGRKKSAYNYYLEGKRTVAPKWKEEWWEMIR